MRRSPWIIALVVAASLASTVILLQTRDASTRCTLDGSPIQPLYEVVVIQERETVHRFSYILSARMWLAVNKAPVSSIWVTDEMTGEKVRADAVSYVESKAVTTPHTGNRVHVFVHKRAAEAHAHLFEGRFVENPLRPPERRKTQVTIYGKHSTNSPDCSLPPSQKLQCLVTEFLLSKEQDGRRLPREQPYTLLAGFSRPPERPPKSAAFFLQRTGR